MRAQNRLTVHVIDKRCRRADAMVEDSGNYTCEVRGRKSTVLASVTYYIFVRGQSLVAMTTASA